MDLEQYTKDVGSRLRRVRQQRGMSLAKVQDATGNRWSAAQIGMWERGDRHIRVEDLADLADFYGVDPLHLLPGAA